MPTDYDPEREARELAISMFPRSVWRANDPSDPREAEATKLIEAALRRAYAAGFAVALATVNKICDECDTADEIEARLRALEETHHV